MNGQTGTWAGPPLLGGEMEKVLPVVNAAGSDSAMLDNTLEFLTMSGMERLFAGVDRVWREGANVVVLSDRGVDEDHGAIPSLLAVSAIEQHLIRTKKRTAVSIILESGEPREVHHFAALLGYGARAVNPYLVQETVEALIDEGILDKDPHKAADDYNSAVLHGIVKKELVSMETVTDERDAAGLRELIAEHTSATGSEPGRAILTDFGNFLPLFKKIVPRDYAEMLRTVSQLQETGISREQAEIEAFYAVTGKK